MLRHQAFFEELASLDEADPAWHAAAAGMLVLRLVDAWIADGPDATASDAWTVRSVTAAISEIGEGSVLRGLLEGVVKVVRVAGRELQSVVPPLMAYGQSLEYEAKWQLAADVYLTLLAHLHPANDAQAVASAYIRLGMCHRSLSQVDEAERAFAAAGEVSAAAGDMEGLLRARIGESRVAILRGNYPDAERILDRTIADAHSPELIDIRSRALQDRSEVAQVRGDHELGIRLAYEAMRTSQSPRERDRILHDIGTAFLALGVYSAARDAFLVVSVTSPEQYVRWSATLNLLDVASATGTEVLFEQHRRELATVALPPALAAAYQANVGEGYYRFGKLDAAQRHLEAARKIAQANGVNRVLFITETLLGQLEIAPTVVAAIPPPLDLVEVATAIRSLRNEVGVA